MEMNRSGKKGESPLPDDDCRGKGKKSMTKCAIDLHELLARVENDRELMQDLLSIFQEEFPQRYRALREAVELRDATRVVMEAHALKGMLSNLAAGAAAAASAELERLGRNKETAKFRESFANFENIANELSRQVAAYIAEVSG
jgi:two-component system, sensor histidine kinase and response regulator